MFTMPLLDTPTLMPKAASLPTVSKAVPPVSYEAALQELERLLSELESGQMPLDQVLAGYQRGAALLAFCRDRLTEVERQIEVLDSGALKPWKPE
jgi:exodeoxyribonuclease VII small subunit